MRVCVKLSSICQSLGGCFEVLQRSPLTDQTSKTRSPRGWRTLARFLPKLLLFPLPPQTVELSSVCGVQCVWIWLGLLYVARRKVLFVFGVLIIIKTTNTHPSRSRKKRNKKKGWKAKAREQHRGYNK